MLRDLKSSSQRRKTLYDEVMNLKNFIVSLLICAQLAMALPSFADPPTSSIPTVSVPVLVQPPALSPDEVPVGAAISPMKKGQIAPFTGLLLSPAAIAALIVELNSFKEQTKIEVDHAVGDQKAQCDFSLAEQKNVLETDKKILSAHITDQDKQISILQVDLKAAEARQTNPALWLGLGALGGFIVTIAIAYVVVQAVK